MRHHPGRRDGGAGARQPALRHRARAALDYALLVDGLAAEREQGVTIDVAYRFFETPRRRFILADTPGHQQYTRNMVTGASTADLAILLVDARKGMLAQTRRHAAIASLLGIRQVVLAVNKMDLVGFDQAVFDARSWPDFRTLLEQLAVRRLTAIPMCARDGDNVTGPARACPGIPAPTLLAALEAAPNRPSRADGVRRPLPVQLVNRPDPHVPRLCRHHRAAARCGRATRWSTPARAPARGRRIVTMDGDLPERRAGRAGHPGAGPGDRHLPRRRAGRRRRRRSPADQIDRLGRLDGRDRRCSAAAPIC